MFKKDHFAQKDTLEYRKLERFKLNPYFCSLKSNGKGLSIDQLSIELPQEESLISVRELVETKKIRKPKKRKLIKHAIKHWVSEYEQSCSNKIEDINKNYSLKKSKRRRDGNSLIIRLILTILTFGLFALYYKLDGVVNILQDYITISTNINEDMFLYNPLKFAYIGLFYVTLCLTIQRVIRNHFLIANYKKHSLSKKYMKRLTKKLKVEVKKSAKRVEKKLLYCVSKRKCSVMRFQIIKKATASMDAFINLEKVNVKVSEVDNVIDRLLRVAGIFLFANFIILIIAVVFIGKHYFGI